jgi:hypothetical protein
MVHVNADSQHDGPPSAAARDAEPGGAQEDPPNADRDFAVVVGVEHYSDIRPLHGARDDATRFHDWLCRKDGGGVPRENTERILSDCKAETPGQFEIDRKLLHVLNKAEESQRARRFYFYFSGHGATNPARTDDDVALLLTQWSRSLAKLALSTQRYSSKLHGAGLFEEVAIFIDCCRNPSLSAFPVGPLITKEWQKPARSTHRFLAFASEAGQPAFEIRKPDGWHGIFTQCLLQILDTTPGISAVALGNWLVREVPMAANRLGLRQRPYVESSLGKPICFGPRREPPILKLRFVKRRGPVRLLDGDLNLVDEHEAGDEPWQLPRPLGLHRIEGGGQDAVLVDHDGREKPHDV